MKKVFLVVLALLILLMGTLPVQVFAEEYSDEDTEPSISLQQAKPVEKSKTSIGTVLGWIFTGAPLLIVLIATIAMRVWERRVWLEHLAEKFGDGDEED